MGENIVLVGAGSAVFTRGLVADLIRLGEPADLGLVDIDPDALAVAEGLVRRMIEKSRAPLSLRASTDRRQVLGGASAVICTVGVGGRRAWEHDVLIPRKYGIYQPVGDTVMPGGTSRALRMIPAMVAIAEDVQDLAPAALFFNYGNPMAAVCRGIRKATGAPVVGLCHGVPGVAEWLARALGADPARLTWTAVGMNHLTWFTEVRLDGGDAMPRLREIAARRIAEAPDEAPFSWRMLLLFGAFPAVLDRHVTEFFPQFFRTGAYYGRTLGVDAFSFEACIAGGDRGHEKMREQAEGRAPLGDDYLGHPGDSEKVMDIIRSVRRDEGRIYSVNLPNRGQVANLPAEAILESPAVVDASGVRAIQLPPVAAGLAGTLATRLQWVETVVEAALEGSREKFIQALVIDGACDSLETAARLADELLAAQAAHLPQFAAARRATA
jgi:alpha-galactosidase